MAAAERIRKPDSQMKPDMEARRLLPVAAHRGDCQMEGFRVSFDVEGGKLRCQNPDQRSNSRSNNDGCLHGSKEQAFHHGAVFFADQNACQKRHGVGHSDGYGIKERICLSVH